MLASSRGLAARHAPSLPSFLLPALQTTATTTPRRHFSATPQQQSKLGRTPISIPPGVELLIGEPMVKRDATSYIQVAKRTVTVTGPLGQLNLEIPPYLKIDHDTEARKAVLTVEDNFVKQQREMWGTTWAYLQRYIMGVSEGHNALLRLVGVGYRATVEPRKGKEQFPGQLFLCLKLGYTHPIEEPIPAGVTVTTPAPTRILVEGIDREAIMSFCGRVRKHRPPEPYKGKGVFINDQTIKLKQKKVK
ncbi:54S ribosomal protein L6 [Plectosphaerella cucumerina]|uniref:Large ribosomal subunit protein uL6m n=1 Tax=Plectosphaerella cucumerina TaxID=40658 RepID=A0A8K0X2E0_9PEZI|nr:54S ribosomal protein L6 [Plectosphaerella cucumerina]